jgi:3-oxoacyl-[acyl-carrier-protein] synthase-3
MSTVRNIKIAGTGSYVPKRVLTNKDLEGIVQTSDEWIVQRTGIRERRIKAEDESTASMSLTAARRALEAAELDPKDLQFIVAGTVTPDYPFPSVGCLLQTRLGCGNIPAFDVSAACTGFIYGVGIASEFIRSGRIDNALAIGAESLSTITDYEDRGTCVLFGDGAGAVILRAVEGESGGRIIGYDIRADGGGAELMYIPGGGSLMPVSSEVVEKRLQFMKMKGRDIFRFAVERFVEQIGISLEKGGLKPSDVNLVIPHQVNIRIITAAVKKLDIPLERVMLNIDRYGNTSAASVPIALDEAVRGGRLRRGHKGIMLAFGAGLTWGSIVFEY